MPVHARQSRLPRWMHHVYAVTHGYFWLPCPVCYRPFGGHEYGATLWLTDHRGKGVCRASTCTAVAEHHHRLDQGATRGRITDDC